jgi:trk system potassium uptake protein TrkA
VQISQINDEKNIIGSLIAKKMGARRVVTLIHESAYVPLLEDADIDIVIGLSDATIGSILSHLRRADVIRDHSLRRGAAEALEIIIREGICKFCRTGIHNSDIYWNTIAI